MTILIIVESPSKCKKIESYLGSEYKCISSYGHFRCITGLKNVKINDTEITIDFDIIKGKEKQVQLLNKEIKKSTKVIIATDDDREGEAIGWHICDYFKLPLNTPRIIFHEVTKSALTKAVENPVILNMSMVNAQHCRQVLDLLVGYKISPVLWNYVSRTQNLSAGRCQTPALSLIYENQMLIENQEYNKIFTICGLFSSKNISFTCHHKFIKEDEILNFLNTSKNFVYNFELGKIVKVEKAPPKPFITSTLQQYTNTYFHYSPKETMSICQKLYENGYITYMRTDCAKYSQEFINYSNYYIKDNYGEEYNSNNLFCITLFDNKKSEGLAQEAHEAIRPTNIKTIDIDDKFSTKEKKIYKLIRDRTLQTMMADALYESYIMKIKAPLNSYYSNTFQNCLFLGWQIVEDKKEETFFHFFRNLSNNNIENNKIIAKETIQNLKTHINEGQMIQLLEKKGIGRPSTYASIVEKLQTRGYVKKENVNGKKIKTKEIVLDNNKIKETLKDSEFGKEKNRLILHPIGKTVYEFLYKYYNLLFKEEFTFEMEKELDDIKENKINYISSINRYNNFIVNLLKDQKKNLPVKEQQVINEKYSYVITKNGPCVTYKDVDNKTIFKNLKKNTNFETCLENSDNIEDYFQSSNDRNLGSYQNKDVIIKNGKYGYYIFYDDKNISIKHLEKKYDDIHLGDVIDLLYQDQKNINILREVNRDISIRKSKFGNYIFYQTEKMKKPKFIKIKDFSGDVLKCSKKEIENFVKTKI